MARLLRRTVAVALVVGVVVSSLVSAFSEGTASAQDTGGDETPAATSDAGFVEVLEVSGLLDDVLADVIETALERVEADGARALVLQVNSKEAVVSDERLIELATRIDESPVPVVAWVGPSGSRAAGGVAQLIGVTDQVSVAIGSKLGPMGDQILPEQRFGVLYGDQRALVAETELNWVQAIDQGVVPCDFAPTDELGRPLDEEAQRVRCASPTVGDFLVGLPMFDSQLEVVVDGGDPESVDADEIAALEVSDGTELRRRPLTAVRFRGLSPVDQLLHTVASPPVAYLMLVIGLALIVFEFYSIGIGIAGVLGAVFAVFGAYGLAALPVRAWAVVALVVAMVAFMIDVQQAIPRAWTVIGMVAFTLGSIFLYPKGDVSMSWIPILVAVVGMAIVMFRGMPIMVRGRFSTSAIPRTFLLDDVGVAVDTVGDDGGFVEIRGVRWRASTADEPIPAGAPVTVTSVDGLALTVASPAR